MINDKKRLQSGTKGCGQTEFEGCVSYPKQKGSATKSEITGKIHGICARCENFAMTLSDTGFCANCEDWFEKNKAPVKQKNYIKAGAREHLGL